MLFPDIAAAGMFDVNPRVSATTALTPEMSGTRPVTVQMPGGFSMRVPAHNARGIMQASGNKVDFGDTHGGSRVGPVTKPQHRENWDRIFNKKNGAPESAALRTRPVIVYSQSWGFGTGGTARFVSSLALWASEWADVHIMCAPGVSEYYQQLFDDHHIQVHPTGSEPEAVALIRSLKPDLIHDQYPDLAFAVKQVLGEFPVVGTSHGWALNHSLPAWGQPIVDSPNAIRSGIDLTLFCPPTERNRAGRNFRVGIIGNFNATKYPGSFLNALENWSHKGIDLLIFGAGAKDAGGGAELGKRLESFGWPMMFGEHSPGETHRVYKELDALLIPSANECCPYVAAEAMASGIPVIGRDIPGIRWMLDDVGYYGTTDAQLLEWCEMLRDDPAECTKAALAGRARAEEYFDLKTMLAAYGRLYSERTGGKCVPGGGVELSAAVASVPGPTTGPDLTVILPVGPNTKPEHLRVMLDSIDAQQGATLGQDFVVLIGLNGVTNPEIIGMATAGKYEVVFSSKNIGAAANHKKLVDAATTPLIAVAHSDDAMPPKRLAEQLAILRADPQVALVCGGMADFDTNALRPLGEYRPAVPLVEQWAGSWPIMHPTVAYRRDVVLAVGNYDPSVSGFCDFDLWCRLQRAGAKIVQCADKTWNRYRTHAGQDGKMGGYPANFVDAYEKLCAKYRSDGKAE